MGSFWQEKAPWFMRKLVFHCKVIGSALSGLEARVLLEGEFKRIEGLILHLARKALDGKATKKTIVGTRLWTTTRSEGGWGSTRQNAS